MHSILSVSALLLAAASSVSAVGRANVVNNCDVDVSLWSVGSAVGPEHRLAARGGKYAEPFVKDAVTGGIALKVTIPVDGLYSGAAQTNFAYNLDNDKIWYDLSDVFGDPFSGSKMVVSSAPSCPSIVFPTGVSPPGSQTQVCGSDQDVTFTICAA